MILSYCHHEEVKDDLYQEVAAKAWRAFDSFSGDCKFSTWISQIARNTAIDYLRQKKSIKTVLHSNILWEIPDTEYKEEPGGLPLSIMDKFSEAEKRTVQMRMDGLPFAEISKITGEPEGRLIVRMHRIKHLLLKGTKRGRLHS